MGDVLPSCRGAGAGLEPGIPARAWNVQSPLRDISSSCSGYTCGWVLCTVVCQFWGSTVCSCHFSVGLFLFACWPMAEDRPWPDSSHETGQITQNMGHTSAWPLLLLLLHLTLCINPIFQYMNSVFQCKKLLFWEFMNPILWYMNPPVSVHGFYLHTCLWEI